MTRPYLLMQAEANRIPLADESVHCVVTSPPYGGLRAHGTIHREGRAEATYRDQAEIGNRDRKRHVTVTTTIGFEKPCCCPYATPVPCVVFDPFVGSGTTCAVAARLGRRSVGMDLSLTYVLEHAKDRVGLACRPSTHRTAKATDSPLFSGVQT